MTVSQGETLGSVKMESGENAAAADAAKPKFKRSRYGCRECKRLKMKCDEAKPNCARCTRQGKKCDYSVTLTWGGRNTKKRAREPKEDKDVPVQFMVNSLDQNDSSGLRQRPAQQNTLFLEDLGQTIHSFSKSLDHDAQQREVHIGKTTFAAPLDESQLPSAVHAESIAAPFVAPDPAPDTAGRVKVQKTGSDYMAKYLKDSLAPGVQSLTTALESIMGIPGNVGHINLLNDLSHFPQDDSLHSIESPSGFLHEIPHSGLTPGPVIPDGDDAQTKAFAVDPDQAHAHTDPFDPVDHPANPDQEIDTLLVDFDTYQEDLLKIDRAFDQRPRALPSFPYASRFGAASRPSQVIDASDVDEDEDDEEFEQVSDGLANYNNQVKAIANAKASSSSSSSPSERFFIPKEIPLLPDLLLNVPYYLECFHFFRDVTSNMLVPAPAEAYKENPFKVILPRLAMTNESILSILIAFGITHKSLMLGQEEPKVILDQLFSRCFKDLILLLEDKETCKSDLTLLLVLMLSSFDIFSSVETNWKLHVQGAKQILIKRGLKNPFDKDMIEQSSKSLQNIDRLPFTVSTEPKFQSKQMSVSEFLVMWFNYIDVLSTLATPLKPSTHGKITDLDYPTSDVMSERSHSSSTAWNSTTASYYTAEEDGEIDMFAGFDARFSEIAAQLIKLIRRTNVFLHGAKARGNTKADLPHGIVLEGIKIRESLGQVFQHSSQKYGNLSDDNSLNVLKCTNEIFYTALLIHLYRRVFLMPKDSIVIKSLCSKTVRILEDKIVAGSNAEICSSFGIFTAAAEVADTESREFLLTRLNNQFHIGNYICKKIREVLVLSWKLDKDWTEIVETYNIDLTFI